MPDDQGFMTLNVQATALRPLLGLTVLLVEDSRFASEAVRLLCIRSGARIRRADSLASARKHLHVYRPSVVIVDLGLPDGSGVDLIATLAGNEADSTTVVIATSGADGDGQAEAAMAAGAHEFVAKPIASVNAFQKVILKHLPNEMRPVGQVTSSNDAIRPDTLALNEDLSHLDDLLGRNTSSLPYIAPFLQGIARLAGDDALKAVADNLSRALMNGNGVSSAVQQTRIAIQTRLAAEQQSIL